MILSATPERGKLKYHNPVDLERYCIEHEGVELLVEFRQKAKLSEKQRMYSFLFGPLLESCVAGYAYRGYEMMDKTKARYLLQAEFAKADMIGPNGVETYLLDLSGMSKARLLKFIQDAVHFIETELDQDVPDSAEYKALKGDGFVSVKFKNQDQ